MAELLRIGNNEADRKLYEQWALDPAYDPREVLLALADAGRDRRSITLRVSKTAGGELRDIIVNPAQCAWFDIVHTEPQQVWTM